MTLSGVWDLLECSSLTTGTPLLKCFTAEGIKDAGLHLELKQKLLWSLKLFLTRVRSLPDLVRDEQFNYTGLGFLLSTKCLKTLQRGPLPSLFSFFLFTLTKQFRAM